MEIDHVHFYVEDATKSCKWFVAQMGFQPIASGASNHTRTEVIKSGLVYFVLSSPLTSASPVAQFLDRHPPGVADVAFRVRDIESVIAKAVSASVSGVLEWLPPQVILQPMQQHHLARGNLKWAKIAGWGNLTHTLIELENLSDSSKLNNQWSLLIGDWLLATQTGEITNDSEPIANFICIDHLALNVAAGDLPRAVAWYEKALSFQRQQTFAIQTDLSGLYSQVMVHQEGGAQLPINQPTSANSQIQEFLDVNGGPGIQHMALRTSNILRAVKQLRQWGLPFIQVTSTYYTQLCHRLKGQISELEWQEMVLTQILVDWQEDAPEALLLQIFTQPIFGQPTFFFELIERRSHARGFGEGNFRALFEAIERAQRERGSLPLQ